jgi:ParB family chromosome partitioning protein
MGDLAELTKSITDKGVLEPILVRPRDDGRFTIISGERRFRASLDAGLTEIPCIEMDVPDNELLEIALIENLQRKDLSPFEEADGYRALQDRHAYTHEQIADAVGKSRVTITEALAIGRLPGSVREECRRADIQSRSFLLELGRLKDEDLMLAMVASMARGDSLTRDSLREAKKDRRSGSTSAKAGALKKAYTLEYAPEDRRYKVSLVLKGRLHRKDDILEAIRDLARRIDKGDIDLESHGRFAKPKGKK